MNLEEIDQIARMETASGVTLSGTYDTPQDYIDALNADRECISYDADTNTAVITSLADFAEMVKPASKGLGAFDKLDAGQGENTLFGYNDGEGAHFDAVLSDILSDIGSTYAADYTEDLQKTDGEENIVSTRLAMYSPLYYLLHSDEDTGEAESTAAKYWRIRTGAWQSDTSITTEINLALALKTSDTVESVDFETVWGMKHTEAERTGNHVENFIAWVNACVSI